MKNEKWTREQTIVAFNLYCKIPFNKVSSNHSDIIKFSKIIGRSPNSLKMKIGNFGSFDPELKKKGIVGLINTSKLDEEIWNEFNQNWENLAYESEILIAKFQNKSIDEDVDLKETNFQGKDKESIVKTRVNQSFFRSSVLSSYNQKCCITGLNIPDLLIASHIIPWSIDEKNRLNPRNGLCLNNLHDKAYDKGFITITTDYKIKLSKSLINFTNNESVEYFFKKYENCNIILPDRFLPDKEFLKYHNDYIFKKD